MQANIYRSITLKVEDRNIKRPSYLVNENDGGVDIISIWQT